MITEQSVKNKDESGRTALFFEETCHALVFFAR